MCINEKMAGWLSVDLTSMGQTRSNGLAFAFASSGLNYACIALRFPGIANISQRRSEKVSKACRECVLQKYVRVTRESYLRNLIKGAPPFEFIFPRDSVVFRVKASRSTDFSLFPRAWQVEERQVADAEVIFSFNLVI